MLAETKCNWSYLNNYCGKERRERERERGSERMRGRERARERGREGEKCD